MKGHFLTHLKHVLSNQNAEKDTMAQLCGQVLYNRFRSLKIETECEAFKAVFYSVILAKSPLILQDLQNMYSDCRQ